MENLGYHISEIPKGVFGEVSKILEEAHEIEDAAKQGVKVMILVELSDLVGCVIEYLKRSHPDTTIEDLIKMSQVTKRAFESGQRHDENTTTNVEAENASAKRRSENHPPAEPKMSECGLHMVGIRRPVQEKPKKTYEPPGCRDWE